MKTVFIQPPDSPECRVLRDLAGGFGIKGGTNERTVLPPLDFAYTVSVLEKNGYCPEIIDAPALDLNVQGVLEKFLKDESDLVVINTTPLSLKSDLEISGLIKEKSPATLVCLTGPFVSVLPEIALNDPNVDIVVRNEIEYTILDLVRALGDKRFRDVKGIVYKKNGKIVKTPDRPLIMNLDELPFPAYHRLPVNRYYHWWLPEKPLLTMLASKGCPFRCIYCPYPVGYGNFWRGRNPENVLAEIQFYVDNFHVKSILFRDQVFTFDMEKTQQLCMGIIERGMDISWACETRVDRLSKKLMTVMKEAGCVGLNLGIESGDPKILSEIGKPGVNIDMIRKVFSDAHEVGIQTGAFFMIGLPGETKQSVWNSFKLMKEINSDIILLAAVTPYPGTELYELAEERGWILTHDWSKYSGFDIVMRTDDMSEQDLIRAMKYWGSFRKYRGKNLKEVRSKSGVKNVILHPLRTAKWALGFVKYHVTNPQKEFEKWALGK